MFHVKQSFRGETAKKATNVSRETFVALVYTKASSSDFDLFGTKITSSV